ncbi:MAG: S41 family peptidase [Ferruginibacter sp.]
MNKWIFFILLGMALNAGCVHKTINKDPAAKEFSTEAIQTDFDVFRTLLKKCHPSLNLYITEKNLDHLLDSLAKQFLQKTSLGDFYNSLAAVINEIGCSHSCLFFPQQVYDTLQERSFFFPYPLELVEDKLLVNVRGYDLPQGTEIREVNGIPVKQILRSLMLYNSVEGFHRKTQQQIAGDEFSMQYYFKYGRQDNFRLRVIDTLGNEKLVDEAPVTMSEWNNRNDSKYYYDNTVVDYDLSFDEKKHYAILRFATFDFTDITRNNAFENFCNNSFDLIHRKGNVKHLIIDLRENHGGKLKAVFLLYSYLAKRPFREYENVTSRMGRVLYNQYLDKSFTGENEINRELNEEFYHSSNNNYYLYADSMNSTWQPKPNRFTGNVYVIANRNVSSAASYFSLLVKNSGTGKIIGEETTGGSSSGNGFQTLEYVLPNTGIRVFFPFAHLVYTNKDAQNTGHGILPDYNVPDSYESFRKNDDRQIFFITDSLILN